jgi:hypothetical protein
MLGRWVANFNLICLAGVWAVAGRLATTMPITIVTHNKDNKAFLILKYLLIFKFELFLFRPVNVFLLTGRQKPITHERKMSSFFRSCGNVVKQSIRDYCLDEKENKSSRITQS